MLEPVIEAPPADCGRRLIPTLIDDIAENDPGRVFAAIPRSSALEDGWQDISYRTIAIAISRCARWIESSVGRSDNDKVLLYMGPLDLRYPIILLAAAKTGHVAQFSSARNSLEAHLSLVERAKCDTILVPDDAPAVTSQIITESGLHVVHAPSLERFLELSDDNDIYPWNATFDAFRTKPIAVLHTSGSTGIPKPVYVTHGTFASNDMHQAITSLGGKPVVHDLMKDKRVFVAFPLFHAACLGMVVGYGPFNRVTCVLPPPTPLTVDVVDKAHRFANIEGSLLPPSVVTDIYKSPAQFENIVSNTKFIAYVGGTLAKEIGDLIAPRIKLFTLMGSTETMWLPVEIVDSPEHWQQIPISPFLGHEYVPRREGLSELVIKRNPELDLFQGAFCTFPHLDEYGMQDLYVQHPDIPRYWSFGGRGDDLICFSNAEKLNPITIETVVSSDPLINGAIVGGHGQFQASLLVEPKKYPESEADREAFIDAIWPTVMKANRDTVAHGRIMKDFIFLSSPDRPFPRAGKDTVQRHAVMKLYDEDFKQLYAKNARESDATADDGPGLGPQGENPPPTQEADEVKPQPSADATGADPKLLLALSEMLQTLNKKVDSIVSRLEDLEAGMQKPIHSSRMTLGQANLRIDIYSDGPDTSTTSEFRRPYLTRSESASSSERASPQTPYPPSHSGSDLQDILYKTVVENAVIYGLTPTENFFNCGLDSLQLQVVVNEVNKRLPSIGRGDRTVKAKDFVRYPTVEKLARAIDDPFAVHA